MMRKPILLLAFCLALPFCSVAQLTLLVNAVPTNTPPAAQLYVAGSFNNWTPGAPDYKLLPLGNGQYSITIDPPVGPLEFKFTRGTWASVEGNANGGFLPNRTVNYNGQPSILTFSILSWEDLGATGGGGTAAPNVQILDNQFYIPQLNRNRRIWLYLPPDYGTSSKKYPVLYMHDGQNLFSNATAPFGEWEVDEALNNLHAQGDWGCIVVGIDHGGQHRLDEYSPWVHPQYGGGQGDEYVDFITSTLKPYIDANYRTMPGRSSTAIAGSSMGGLISMYALAERQDVFSKAGVFSPAFWFSQGQAAAHVAAHPKQGNVRVYFLAGADEENDGGASNYVVEDIQAVVNAMSAAGFGPDEQSFNVIADGEHSEWFWRREFPAAYQWLFANWSTSVATADVPNLEIFPNPSSTWVQFSGFNTESELHVQVFGADGKLWQDTVLHSAQPLWTGELPQGFYLVKARVVGSAGWAVARLVRK